MPSSLTIGPYEIRSILLGLASKACLHHERQPAFLFAASALDDGESLLHRTGLAPSVRQDVADDILRLFALPDTLSGTLLDLPTLAEWGDALARQWNGHPEALVFHTSGSTGKPGVWSHPFSVLEQEVRFLASLFLGRSRILTIVPRHHVYGFIFSVLLPQALKCPVVTVPPFPSPSFLSGLRKGDLILAFPLFWKAMAQLLDTDRHHLPDGVCGISSTGPCPAEIIHRLLEKGLERMTEIYGSTETSAVGTRHHPDEPYTLLPYWQTCRSGTPGENDIVALRRHESSGAVSIPYPLPDDVSWTGERSFSPMKRKDKAVQVGGVNVYPERIAGIIETHPDVQACKVRLMRPEEGNRLKAFIVPTPDARGKIPGLEFRNWLARQLTSPETPRSFIVGDALPVTPIGKDCDWDIAEYHSHKGTPLS